jgi:hypothetical protein
MLLINIKANLVMLGAWGLYSLATIGMMKTRMA